MDNPGVIVLGGHVQGLGIIRIFGENNIPSILFDTTSHNLAKHSKYCKSFFLYKENNLLQFLLDFKKNLEYKNWLLFPTNDHQVMIISQNKELLSDFYKVTTGPWDMVHPCYNKRLTYSLAQRLCIPLPATWSPDSLDELMQLPVNYPCIVKPAVMHRFYKQFKTKVLLCTDYLELEKNYRKAIRYIPANEIIIQEVIPGSSENQYSACFMYHKDRSLVSFTARRKRQHPVDFGNATTFAETVNIPELVGIAEKLLKELRFVGICEVEFKFDQRDNKYKFLEINARTWKWHSLAEKSESPFLMSLYNYMTGDKEIIKNDWKQAGFMHLMTDIPIILLMILQGNFRPSQTRNIQHAVWDKKDIWPALFEIINMLYYIIKR